MSLIRTPEFETALRLMESDRAFTFITGRAGTGKSTLLKHFRETTTLATIVLAPTGVAALNVDGETIHRFFRFAPGITVKDAKRRGASTKQASTYRNAELLIIDEISMVRADLLDCVDQFLQGARACKLPFGGLRVVAIGDLHQLPPVISTAEQEAFARVYESPYFFSSHVVRELLGRGHVSHVELEHVFRQADSSFIALLNAVRDKRIAHDELTQLNTRVSAERIPEAIILTSTNAAADTINEQRLRALKGTEHTFSGTFHDQFPERESPTDPHLCLKKGARVMCVANDPAGRFVNGSLGWVVGFDTNDEGAPCVLVEMDDGGRIAVSDHTWTVFRSTYDARAKTLQQERLGSFSQIPLKLAWAVTIHKSQGKTFDQVTVDLGSGAFANGQTYVALSRCRSLEGLTLARPIRLHDIRVDAQVGAFLTALQARRTKTGRIAGNSLF